MLSFWRTAKTFGTVASLDYKEQTTTALRAEPWLGEHIHSSATSKTTGEVTVTAIHSPIGISGQTIGVRSISWECQLYSSGVPQLCSVWVSFKETPEISYCRTHSSPIWWQYNFQDWLPHSALSSTTRSACHPRNTMGDLVSKLLVFLYWSVTSLQWNGREN